jgi:serine/threonine-protein kinase
MDHGVGTLLNLADCYEQNGQTASAWAEFRIAAAAASAAGQGERERIARERERRLLPLLARLIIAIPPAQAASTLTVRRDDLVLDRSLWGVAVPIDPGDHSLVVSAHGKRPYTETIHIPARPGARVTVAVPALADLPARELPSPAAPVRDPGWRGQQIAGVALVGVGLAGLVSGSALGLSAIARNNSAAPHCRGDDCDPRGVALRSDALRAGTASTAAFIAAGALLAGGAAIYFTAPKQGQVSASAAQVSASAALGISATGGVVLLGARW